MISTNSTRQAFSDAMEELVSENPRVMMVTADTVGAMRATSFAKNFPDHLIDIGIAEQCAVNTAAGLASCGLIPFVATYAGFITMRACEQMRTFVAYPGLNVKFVGANGGIFSGEREGVTHQFFEDIAIARSMPGMTVIVPADANQTYLAVKALAKHRGPAYLRIGSGKEHIVFDEDVEFEIGMARILCKHGDDVALLACGLILDRVLEAAKQLKDMGILSTVVEVHTIKPLDEKTIADVLNCTRAAVTVEDHNVLGGLGSAVCEVSAKTSAVPIERVGLQDVWPQSGEANELIDKYNMRVVDIIHAAKKAISRKKSC